MKAMVFAMFAALVTMSGCAEEGEERAGTCSVFGYDMFGNPTYSCLEDHPPDPTRLWPTAIGYDGEVRIRWNELNNATRYDLYRGESSGSHTLRMSEARTPFVDRDVRNGITYYYVVVASGPGGQAPPSGEFSATPNPAPDAAPLGLNAQAGFGTIVLSWAAVERATWYRIYWAREPGVLPGNYASLAGGSWSESRSTTASLEGFESGVRRWFVVTAANAAGEGPASTEVSLAFESASLPPDFSPIQAFGRFGSRPRTAGARPVCTTAKRSATDSEEGDGGGG